MGIVEHVTNTHNLDLNHRTDRKNYHCI